METLNSRMQHSFVQLAFRQNVFFLLCMFAFAVAQWSKYGEVKSAIRNVCLGGCTINPEST